MSLLDGALDYAGLFPPAALEMGDAVRSYAAHRRGLHGALLGRFVVPVARLAELAAAADEALEQDPEGGWDVSVIGAGDPREDSQLIADVEARHGGGGPTLAVRSIERKVESDEEIAHVVGAYHDGGGRTVYVEIPPEHDRLPELLGAVRAAGACAKLRTGGTTVDAFPQSAAVARFVAACARAAVPFKATAGLHHAVRGEYRIDYQPKSPCVTMHGFLNLFVGTVLLDAGRIDEHELSAVLAERGVEAFELDRGVVRWRDRGAGPTETRRARERLLHSFGTCSFEEPIEELRAIGWLS